MLQPLTIFEKIWNRHAVRKLDDGRYVIHIDRHIVHEGTSRDAFRLIRQNGESVLHTELTCGVIDHVQSTLPGRNDDSYPPRRSFIVEMRQNCADFGITFFDMEDPQQGIVHLIGPELGFTLPGVTLVCADSHTATHGGLGAWAWGIGQTEVRQVLTHQALIQSRPMTMRVTFDGRLAPGTYAKDLILYLIGQHGVAAGTGYVIEYAGSLISSLPVEGRLTICNMSIEFGARSGIISPDDVTLEYLHGRRFAPKGALWDRAVADWRMLATETEARFDREIAIDCNGIAPQVTWGNSPEDVIAVDQVIPDPTGMPDSSRRARMTRALEYMDVRPGMRIEGLPVDVAFIGSCTNSRLSDFKAAADVVRGRKVADGVRAWAVPGSKQVKHEAEALGLDKVFRDAGFEWRDTGCSMCVAANGEMVAPGERSISSSNRNFESRQGPKSRTHLASPATVAASAVAGRIADPRKIAAGESV